MSKVVTSIRGTSGTINIGSGVNGVQITSETSSEARSYIIPDTGSTGYLATVADVTPSRTITAYTTSQDITIPAGIFFMEVKLWGAGGEENTIFYPSRPKGGLGGGGGYARWEGAVTPGEVYNLSVGAVGAGGASGAGFGGGRGGGMSVLSLKSGSNFIVKAIAGGGGGAGEIGSFSGVGNGHGGGAEQNGFTGGTSGPGQRGFGGTGGAGGTGGLPGIAGTNVPSLTVTSIGSLGGNGGNGGPSSWSSSGGGGGDGYGGGGGGGNNSSSSKQMSGAGGGGGGNYTENGETSPGSGTTPGNASDPDRVTYGVSTAGTDSVAGAFIVYLGVEEPPYVSLEVPDDTVADAIAAKPFKIFGINKAAGTGDGGDIELTGGSSAGGSAGKVKINSTLITADINPESNNSRDLGNASNRWREVFAVNGTINTSDRREKRDIKPSDLGLNFINMLKPVQYKWIEGVRPHYGFISQDLKEVMDELGVDFGGYTKSIKYKEDPEGGEDIPDGDVLGIRYNELIAPLTKAVQELSQKNDTLEKRNNSLEETCSNLLKVSSQNVSRNQELCDEMEKLVKNVDSITTQNSAKIVELSENLEKTKEELESVRERVEMLEQESEEEPEEPEEKSRLSEEIETTLTGYPCVVL